MSEGREESIPTREEVANDKRGKTYVGRVMRMIEHYTSHCRSLRGLKKEDRRETLERQKEVVLQKLTDESGLNVHEDWIWHNGKTPLWLKSVREAEKLLTEEGDRERILLPYEKQEIDVALESFNDQVSFDKSPWDDPNKSLLTTLRQATTYDPIRHLASRLIKSL